MDSMKLTRYLNIKFGNNTSSINCIAHMLHACFFARSFASFWRHWNPLWSYFLLYYVYKPLSSVIKKRYANFSTFVISGFVHDCVAMLLTFKLSIVMTTFFSMCAGLVAIENALKVNMTSANKILKALYHCSFLLISALPAVVVFQSF